MRSPDFWYPKPGATDPLAVRLLQPLAHVYQAGARLRTRLTKPAKVPVPVICIGNLVAGGTGKTPLALMLADRLLARGEAVHFLTRGYGGRERGPLQVDHTRHIARDVGDEPLLLAAAAPTWVAANRVRGAQAAAHQASVLIMDDGFQNPSLHKDLSLLVVDSHTGFGNGRTLPAGPLREPPEAALARAQALVMMGEGTGMEGGAAALADAAGARGLPVFHAHLDPEAHMAHKLEGMRLLAFAGIGRPEKFFATLRRLGARVEETVAFADHHAYEPAEATQLLARAAAMGTRLITTEKDRIRLAGAERGSPLARLEATTLVLPVRAAVDEAAALDTLIDGALKAAFEGERRRRKKDDTPAELL